MRASLVAAVAVVWMCPEVAAAPPQRPPAGTVTMDSVSVGGSGCAAPSVNADISSDGQAITVSYSQLNVAVGPDANGERSVDCNLDLRLTVPKGWQYALANVDFRGYAFLEDGVSAVQSTRFHIQGEAPETGAAATLAGPSDGEYLLQTLGTDGAPAWSRCGKGKFVKLKTTLRVSNAGAQDATGMLFVTSTDAQIYRLVWQRCQQQP